MFTNLREFVINPKFAAAISIFVELSIAISALVNEIHSKAEKTVLIVLALAIPVMWMIYFIVKNLREEYCFLPRRESHNIAYNEEEICFTEDETRAVYNYAIRAENGKMLSKTEILTDVTITPFKQNGLTRYALIKNDMQIFWFTEHTSGLLTNMSSDGELICVEAAPLEIKLVFRLPKKPSPVLPPPKTVKFSIYDKRTSSPIFTKRAFATPTDEYIEELIKNDTF